MLSLKFLRSETERVRKALADRRSDYDLDGFLALDDRRRAILGELEALRNRRNVVSKEVGRLKKEGGDAAPLFEEMKANGLRTKELEEQLKVVEPAVQTAVESIPNIPHASVPSGCSETDNREIRRWG